MRKSPLPFRGEGKGEGYAKIKSQTAVCKQKPQNVRTASRPCLEEIFINFIFDSHRTLFRLALGAVHPFYGAVHPDDIPSEIIVIAVPVVNYNFRKSG